MEWTKPVGNGIDWGTGPNRMPEPYREIFRVEFDLLMFCDRLPDGIGYESVHLDGVGWSVKFYHFPHYTLAVADRYGRASDHHAGVFVPKGKPYYGTQNGHYLRFFRVGCEHVWRELSPAEARENDRQHYGMFCHVYKCDQCGTLQTQDSSG